MTRRAALAPALALALAAAGGAHAQQATTAPPVERETAKEFLDSLADTALAPDPNRLYRKDGARREVQIRPWLAASLDERAPSLLDSPVAGPGIAGAPGRVFAITARRPGLFGEFSAAKTAVARDTALLGRWQFADRLALFADLREQRSSIEDVDARRRDAALALRWQAWPEAWLDAGVHRASIEPASGDPASTAPEGAETFWRVRGRWQPLAVPGLGLGAAAERAISRPADPLGAGRLEFGADYTLQPGNPLGPAFDGARLLWREAPKLGLLSDGSALDPRAAWKRTIGGEVPDGSPGGAVYAQWRAKSVASDADEAFVVGWRHAFAPRERWLLQTHVEQAVPIAGPNAVRSLTVGGRLWRGAHPSNTFVTDLEIVNSERDDSLYGGIKYTVRLAQDWLSALRLSATHTQPHGDPDAGSTSYKASVALGWREHEERRLAVLGRYTLTGTEATEAAGTDRRAHILLAGANYVIDPRNAATVRWSRRWERDETRPALDPRVTTLAMARWVHEWRDRWSWSVHAARYRDDLDGNATGFGAELGFKLSSKAVLAVGYNPRGFRDHEIEVDERLKQGLTLRLRFSIEAALARWLDPPMPKGE